MLTDHTAFLLSYRWKTIALLLTLIWARIGTVHAEDRWVPLGPWIRSIYAVAIDPANPSTIYLASDSGIFRSDNREAHWKALDLGLSPDLRVYDLATVSTVPPTLYAGTSSEGVFQSQDGGETWRAVNDSLGTSSWYDFAFDPITPTIQYAAVFGRGVFRSTNSGDTWVEVNNGLTDHGVFTLAIDPNNPSTLFAGTFSGAILRSIDRGEKWVLLDIDLFPATRVSALAVSPTNPSSVYAGTDGGVFRSENNGESWSAVNSGLDDSIEVLSLAIDPVLPDTIYAGSYDRGAFRSVDGGGNWTAINDGLRGQTVWTFAIGQSNSGVDLYAGTIGAGVYRSRDRGTNWTEINSDLPSSTIQAMNLEIDPLQPSTLYCGTHGLGVMRSMDSGKTWVETRTGLSDLRVYALAIDPVTPSTLYAGLDSKGVFRSTNSGRNWMPTNNGIASSSDVYSFAVDPQNPSTIYTGTWPGGVYRTRDGGESWVEINNGLGTSATYALAIDPSYPSTLFAGTYGDGVFRSTDWGDSWIAVNVGLMGQRVHDLRIDPVTTSILYVVTESRVYRSTNAAETWEVLAVDSETMVITSLAIDPVNPSVLYAGSLESGVFRSIDRGDSWETMGAGLEGMLIMELVIDPKEPSNLYAQTAYDGVFGLCTPELQLCFAQFGEGNDQLFSQIQLFSLDDAEETTARVKLRDNGGEALSVDLNGEEVTGELEVTIPASGLRVLRTDGHGPLAVGSVVVYSEKPLAGVILFGGVVGVAGVGESAPLQNGFSAPMESNHAAGVNTGVAMVNLRGAEMLVKLMLCDAEGDVLANSEVTLAARGHLAQYINEFSWDQNIDFSDFLGLLKVSAPENLAATVIQTRPGEFATMPVAERLSDMVPAAQTTIPYQSDKHELHFSQFGDGDGQLFSQIMLINRSEEISAQALLHLRGDDGQDLSVDLNGEWIEGQLEIVVPAGGLRVLQTDSIGALTVGSVTVTSDQPLAGVVLFGGSMGLAGVGSVETLDNGFIAPIEMHLSERIKTGIAIMNLEDDAVVLELALQDPEGEVLATTQLSLPALGHRARFVDEFEWSENVNFSAFQGLLRVTSTTSIAGTVLQTRPSQLATMPVIPR